MLKHVLFLGIGVSFLNDFLPFRVSKCVTTTGIKKTYWITCNVEPDVHQLSLERDRYPSNFVVRPRDLSRLLTNFQSSLHEITIIASDLSADVSGGKAVELRSYIDPLKGEFSN